MPRDGAAAQNCSVQPRANPSILAVLLLPTATSPGTPGFAVSLSPAQILLKTLPFHFPRDAQLIFSCPLRGASGVCGWAGAGRALLTGSDYPAAPRGGGAGRPLPNLSPRWMGAWIISARLGAFRRCARSAAQPASSESSWHRHLSPKPVCMKGCLHNRGKKERHDSTISESK